MPSNLLKLSSSDMESEFHRSMFERSGSFDSQGSRRSRSRSSTFDDENLKYLTSEEKNALMFLEETLDAFEDDAEELPIPLNSTFGYYSPRSIEDSHSDNEDIIDLVQKEHNRVGISLGSSSGLTYSGPNYTHHDALLEANYSTSASMIIPAAHDEDTFFPEHPADHPRLLGAIPTPVIIAQKISEKKTDNGHLSLISPKDEKLPELKKNVATSPISDSDFAFPSSPISKLSRFPNNISVKRSGKEYNKTIAKAAVNVTERRAKVLANLNGPGLAEEIDGKTREPLTRRTSVRDVAPEQARYIALTKLGLINEAQVQADLQTTSLCTSPVSNGQHSPTFFLPDSQRRLSNDQVRNNNHQSLRAFSPEPDKNISHEQQFIKGQQPSYFSPDSKKISHEKHYLNGPLSPKHMSPESKKIIPQEQHFANGQQFPRILPPESSKMILQKQHYFNSPQSPKLMYPESNKKISDEQNFVSSHSAKYFPSETKKGPSKDQDDIVSQYSVKSLPTESKRTLSNEQSISSVLISAPSSFVPVGKTIAIKGETSEDKSKVENNILVSHEEKPKTRPEIKRTYSVPRPTGFRPQGITVQFSGRNSSEDSRKDALRKLGLLKEEYRP